MVVKKRNIFYGWWIVLFTAITRYIESGTFFYGAGVFFTPIRTSFNWSYSQTSIAFTLQRLESGVIAPVAGWLVDKLGPRRMILIGWAVTGLGFILMSRIMSLWSFYATFITISVGMSLGGYLASNTVVSRWFSKKRSRAFTFSSFGAGISGTAVPLLELLIRKLGWRHTLTVTGITTWLICLPVGLFIRDDPRKYGMYPDGERSLSGEISSTETIEDKVSLVNHSQDLTLSETIRTRAFWMLSAVNLFQMISTGAIFVHMIPYMESLNYSRTVAATTVSVITVYSLVGRFGFGVGGDFINKRLLMTIALTIQTAGIFIFSIINPDKLWTLILFLLVYGLGYGALMVLKPAIQADYFGTRHYGKIMGAMSIITLPGGLLSPVIAGYIFDITNSYVLAWQIFAFISLPTIPLMILAKAPYWQSQG